MTSDIHDSILTRQSLLVEKFNNLNDWEARYSMIIDFGKQLPTMPQEHHSEENKVRGCQSQVWLYSEFKDGKIWFYGDSDAAIVKGLVAMLVYVYSGATPLEVFQTSPQFIEELGLNQHLSQTRTSGLAAMVKQMKIYGYAWHLKEQGTKPE